MADDERMTFTESPSGAYYVEVTWIRQGEGRFGRDKTVSRSQATHARIEESGGAQAGERTVTAIEANAYVAELQRLQDEADEREREGEEQREEALDRLASTCPHCEIARSYEGRRRLQSGGVGAEMVFGEMLSVSNADVHWYACPRCGSIELFADGVVDHPLRGNL